MKKRYALKICLNSYLFFFLTISSVHAQDNSEAYLSIKNDTILSNLIKEYRIDSLFITYKKEEAKRTFLAHDLYDYILWHYRNGSLDKAISTSKECISIINSLPVFDSLRHKKAYNNLGFFYGKKGDYYNAYKTNKSLTSIGKLDSYTAKAYRLTARNLSYLGDFYKAAEYYEKSIIIAQEIGDTKMAIVNSIDASINYKEIGTIDGINRGIEILREAIQIANSVNQNSVSDQDKIPLNNLFSIYNNLANLFNDRDDYDFKNSKLNYDISLALAFKLKDSVLISNVYNDLGYLYVHDARIEALKYLEKALLHKPDKKLGSLIYANKSLYFSKLNDTKKALYNIQLSINELTPILVDDFTSLPSKESVSNSLHKYELLQNLVDKAKIWLGIYEEQQGKENLFNALKTLKLADYLVDIIRFETDAQQSKLFWRKTASEIYVNAVKACFYLNMTDEGFYFMEKNKALLLLEHVSLRQQREQATIPESIYKRQIYLKKQILHYTSIQNNAEEKDSVRSLLFDAKESHTNFIDSLQEDYKLYYKVQKPAQTIALNEAQKALDKKNRVYVEYILGEDEGYGMLITNTSARFFEIDDNKELLKQSKKFRSLLESPLKTQKDKEVYANVAFSIYKSLFPNEIIREITNKKLIIIPDYYLQNIPFEALLTSNEPTSYFIKKHDINYAYSVSFLDQNKQWKSTNSNDFIGFAPIDFKDGLSSLPDSKQEIEMSSSLFSSTPFLYKDATKKNFSMNVKGHNIVHIASHSNTTQAGNSWIVFDDAELTLDELYLTENSADLVVLSACKTSMGELNQGEGVMSLARGFFNTGANSVLSTLWDVNDTSSAEIIKSFYLELKKGKTKSEALHIAKLNYLNNHELSEQSPYHWASFVLIGDHESINLLKNDKAYIKILLSIVVILTVILLYRKVRTKA